MRGSALEIRREAEEGCEDELGDGYEEACCQACWYEKLFDWNR